jgi:type IV pilus assembly protein PilA
MVASRDEQGFTLIELLVVILVIGVLAAIVIPSFLNQRAKALDAGAKELGHAAQIAAESYATDNSGSYVNLTPALLDSYESTIPTSSSGGNAYVSAVTNATANGYTITIKPGSGNEVFTITRSGGTITRTCTVGGVSGSGGGCLNGTW